jgi:flagellar hook-associated protein 1 FlgK
MQNVTIPKYIQFIDTLAASFIKEVNNIHSEGVGLSGGFTSLTSTNKANDADDLLTATGLPFEPVAGNLYVTVTSDSTGDITKSNISIASNETLNTLTAKITALSNIAANTNNGILTISADSGYTFNFSKELDSNPDNIGSAVTSVSGYYTGDDNDTFTLTVIDAGVDGEIGKGSAKIEVTDALGTVITTLDVGSSYTQGNPLAISDGVSVSFGSGNIALNQNMTFDVVSDPDTSNVLTSLGLNTFFEGNDASTIGVSQYIADDASRIAVASSSSPGDNTNARRLIDLQHSTLTNNTTFSDFLHSSVAQLGIETVAQLSSKESFQTILTNLDNRRQEISGVSIDEEMINTMRFQQAFQASARYISVISEMNKILMGI